MNKQSPAGMKKLGFIGAGVAGGFAAVTCCVAPVVLVLLGVGTAASMAFMHRFHAVSIASGIVLMLLIALYLVKRKSGVCDIRTVRAQWKPIAASILILLASWLVLNYLVVAPIAAVVYGSLPVHQTPLGSIPEMAASHGMPEMADIRVIPENKGVKQLDLQLEGVFCGSCAPAIEYDLKSIAGVIRTKRDVSFINVTYDSDVTSKDVILASIHEPYSAKIIKEQCEASGNTFTAC